MEKKIMEGNAKIGEFMKLKPTKFECDSYVDIDPTLGVVYEDPKFWKYHSSWNWLIPAWDKLSSALRESMPIERYLKQLDRFANAVHCNDIAKAFGIVSENVNWYTLNVSKDQTPISK